MNFGGFPPLSNNSQFEGLILKNTVRSRAVDGLLFNFGTF